MHGLFVVNILLVLADASLGYRCAPRLLRLVGHRFESDDPEEALHAVRSVRRMLTGVVSLYMFFNCLAFYHGDLVYLLLVTGFILLDIILVLYFAYLYRRGKAES